MDRPQLLVVEDEPLILMDIESNLVDAGFSVITATNAAGAIRLLDDPSLRIDGMLTDIRLGNGIPGWDIARHARERTPGIPVIYISGHGAAEWTACGVPESIMIAKPFVMAQIITAVTTLLNKSSSHSPTA